MKRSEAAWILVGGRDLAAPTSRPSVLDLAIDGRTIESWRLDPAGGANFLRVIALPGGVPDGPGAYATLTIAAKADVAEAPTRPIAIRQFDLQSAPTLMYGFGDGWHEEEYEASSGRRWRWTTSSRKWRSATRPCHRHRRIHRGNGDRHGRGPGRIAVTPGVPATHLPDPYLLIR